MLLWYVGAGLPRYLIGSHSSRDEAAKRDADWLDERRKVMAGSEKESSDKEAQSSAGERLREV